MRIYYTTAPLDYDYDCATPVPMDAQVQAMLDDSHYYHDAGLGGLRAVECDRPGQAMRYASGLYFVDDETNIIATWNRYQDSAYRREERDANDV